MKVASHTCSPVGQAGPGSAWPSQDVRCVSHSLFVTVLLSDAGCAAGGAAALTAA